MQTTCPENETTHHVPDAIKAGAGLALAAGLGAGLMYFFDPNRGRARRAMARDRAIKLYHQTVHEAERTIEDLENRVEGVVHEAEAQLHATDPVPDDTLTARVRTKLGRLVAQPHRVGVTSTDGHVTLAGQVRPDEVHGLELAVRLIPGVKDVDNRLEMVVRTNEIPKGLPRVLAEIAALASVSTLLLSKTR